MGALSITGCPRGVVPDLRRQNIVVETASGAVVHNQGLCCCFYYYGPRECSQAQRDPGFSRSRGTPDALSGVLSRVIVSLTITVSLRIISKLSAGYHAFELNL